VGVCVCVRQVSGRGCNVLILFVLIARDPLVDGSIAAVGVLQHRAVQHRVGRVDIVDCALGGCLRVCLLCLARLLRRSLGGLPASDRLALALRGQRVWTTVKMVGQRGEGGRM
jgi:hypothetical protein